MRPRARLSSASGHRQAGRHKDPNPRTVSPISLLSRGPCPALASSLAKPRGRFPFSPALESRPLPARFGSRLSGGIMRTHVDQYVKRVFQDRWRVEDVNRSSLRIFTSVGTLLETRFGFMAYRKWRNLGTGAYRFAARGPALTEPLRALSGTRDEPHAATTARRPRRQPVIRSVESPFGTLACL